MGHKVHPIGFRLGQTKTWASRWYAEDGFKDLLLEDISLRNRIFSFYPGGRISRVEIERGNEVAVTIYTARPGIVIGKAGQRVDELRALLEKEAGKRIRLNIKEINLPEIDAHLVAEDVALQLERRISPRRAIRQAIFRAMEAGARGIKVQCSGRLGGQEIARRITIHEGGVPLHTIRADIDYGFVEANTAMGKIGVKVWIYHGDILPPAHEEEIHEEEVEDVTAKADEIPEAT